MSLSDYAALVRIERGRKGWTQRELARRAGVSAPTVARMENGGNVNVDVFLLVMGALGLALIDSRTCEHEYVCTKCGDLHSG